MGAAKKNAAKKNAAKKKTVAKNRSAPLTFDRYLARVQTVYEELKLAPPEKKKPANEVALAALERAIGHMLPAGLRAAWLVANGAGDDELAPLFWRTNRYTGYALVSVAEAKKSHAGHERLAKQYADAEYEDPEPRDRQLAPGWFLPGWLPFADFGGGTLRLLIDFTPSSKGTVGQVIAFTHDPDEMTWVAGSFDEFLRQSIDALESDPDGMLAPQLDEEDGDDDA